MNVPAERIHFVGNTMIDTLLFNLERLRDPQLPETRGLEPGRYFVLTLHRPNNVDANEQFFALLEAISDAAEGLPVIFPVHPRTAKLLAWHEGRFPAIRLLAPQPYLEFNWLVRGAMAVITDSGGISEETTVLGVPCLTMRDTTERPETIEIGTNELIGTDLAKLRRAMAKVRAGDWKQGRIPERWDGKAAERIARVLDLLAEEKG
jgi:UDP-N-acetylglucosamine 2-epimerase (non-hydrolysing)